MDGVGAANIENCGCCYDEFQIEKMVECSNGRHRFCFKCLRKQIEEIIYGGRTADAYLPCMDINTCSESIPLSQIRRALPNDVLERYENRQAQQSIEQAKLEGLVYCPFCNIPYEVDVKCVDVLDCPNPKCLKVSCIQCKKLRHVPLNCEEVEEISIINLRRKVEESMTKAVVRKCNSCPAELIKTGGCNKITCKCGNLMCYVCRMTVSRGDNNHFCSCRLPPAKFSCKKCNKCSLFGNEVEDNEALAAKEEALKELVDKEPKLIDLKIGPPLKKVRQQTPTEEQGHPRQPHRRREQFHFQRLPPYRTVHFQEFVGIDDQFENIGLPSPMPLPEFLRHDHEHADMVGHPPLPIPDANRLSDQVENMPVPTPVPVGVEIFRSSGQYANMDKRPPHFLRIGDGDQLANTVAPPPSHTPEFFQNDDHIVNKQLQAEEDNGRERQLEDK